MDHHPLGASGLLVSRFVLGTLTFAGTHGFDAVGATTEAEARRLVDVALDAGVNAFDTADLYSRGDAERVLGAALAGRRDRALVFTKAGFPMSDDPNDAGASRAHLVRSLDRSLARLRTDWVDLYFVHLWDGRTPVEETIAAMTALVRAGKIRYWGVSNYSGWQLARTVTLARALGLEAPVCHQLYYTPEAREAEYELLPAGAALGVGAMIWSPLGMGLLGGRVSRTQPPPPDTRQGSGRWREPWVQDRERLYAVIDALAAVGAECRASVAQVALAWVRERPHVGPVVIGARTETQLRENLAAATLTLTPEQHARIEAVARPAPLYPHWHRAANAMGRAMPEEAGYLQGHRRTLGLDA